MTTAIAPANGTAAPIQTFADSKEIRDLVRATVFPGANDAELSLYFHDCQRQGVHPLDRLIHPQIRKSGAERRYVAVTSIDLMRARAGDTGDHAGTDDAVYGPLDEFKNPSFATVTVYRIVHGQRVGFTATARFSEYVVTGRDGAPSGQWGKMPYLMIAKCAEALALRKAFPRQLSGIYSPEEMAQAGPPIISVQPAPGPFDDSASPHDEPPVEIQREPGDDDIPLGGDDSVADKARRVREATSEMQKANPALAREDIRAAAAAAGLAGSTLKSLSDEQMARLGAHLPSPFTVR